MKFEITSASGGADFTRFGAVTKTLPQIDTFEGTEDEYKANNTEKKPWQHYGFNHIVVKGFPKDILVREIGKRDAAVIELTIEQLLEISQGTRSMNHAEFGQLIVQQRVSEIPLITLYDDYME